MDNLGIYLLGSLFFVVAAMVEFSIALLVKRNPRCEWMGRQKISGNQSKEKTATYELQIIEVVANKRRIITENMLNYSGCPEDKLRIGNSMFNEKALHLNEMSTGFEDDADGKDSRCLLPSANVIDMSAFVLFPSLYLAYNFVYWYWVLYIVV